MRPRPSPQTPRWQGRAAAIDRRPWRRPLCASWLSLTKSSLTAFSVAEGPHHRSTGSESEQKSDQREKQRASHRETSCRRRTLGWPEQIVDTIRAQMQSITKIQIQTMDQMMDAWEEQIKSPNPMTGSSSAMLSKLTSLPGISPTGSWPNASALATNPMQFWMQWAEQWQKAWADAMRRH